MMFVEQLISPFLRNKPANDPIDRESVLPLIHLLKQRQLLEVSIDGYRRTVQSMVVDIDLERGELMLDGFSPKLIDRTSVIGSDVTITHNRGHRKLSFTKNIKHWDPAKDAYTIDLPSDTTYTSRRAAPRVELNTVKPMYAIVKPVFGAPWQATIKNISQGGARVSIAGDVREWLSSHSALPECAINVSPGMVIKTKGMIRGYRFSGRPYRHTEVSIEFLDLSAKPRSQLERLVDTLSTEAA